MSKILVVYFSRTGTTKSVATSIARELGCQIESIAEDRSRAGLLGWIRSGYQATFGKTAAIQASLLEPSDYDLVVIGTPTWNQSPSSPVVSYVRTHRKALSKVAFFCTFGGRGEENVFSQLTRETGLDPVAVLGLKREQVESGLTHSKIVSFAHAITNAAKGASEDSGPRAAFRRSFQPEPNLSQIVKGACS